MFKENQNNNKNNFSIIIDIYENYKFFAKVIFIIILKFENIDERE